MEDEVHVLLQCPDERLTGLRDAFLTVAFREDPVILQLGRTRGSLELLRVLCVREKLLNLKDGDVLGENQQSNKVFKSVCRRFVVWILSEMKDRDLTKRTVSVAMSRFTSAAVDTKPAVRLLAAFKKHDKCNGRTVRYVRPHPIDQSRMRELCTRILHQGSARNLVMAGRT